MSGIQLHSEDPISPEKASTPHNSNVENPSQPAQNTAPSPYAYPPAQPGAAAPTATRTIPPSSGEGPPAPQPGGVPVPPPPTITAPASLPPPPKAGEKALPPEHYAPVHSTSVPPQPYPSQLSQPRVDAPLKGVPAGSTTSASTRPSFNPSVRPSNSTDTPVRASLEHPPGYVQNPFASDMTPDQRFAAEQEHENRSDTSPPLGYTDNAQGRKPSLEDDETVWGTAVKWAKETGEQASKVWDKLGGER